MDTGTALMLLLGLSGQVLCYSSRPYWYRSRFLSPAPLENHAYSAMSDIDWSKRSSNAWGDGGNDNNWGYSSMADHDWGWKKRSAAAAATGNSYNRRGGADDSNNYYLSYVPSIWQGYYRPYGYAYSNGDDNSEEEEEESKDDAPIALASRSYNSPSSSYRSIRAPSYNYVGMADLDWGWKKRKRSAPVQKRHLASLVASGQKPSRRAN